MKKQGMKGEREWSFLFYPTLPFHFIAFAPTFKEHFNQKCLLCRPLMMKTDTMFS